MKHRAAVIAVAAVAVLLTMWHFQLDFVWPVAAGAALIAAGAALDHQKAHVHGGLFGFGEKNPYTSDKDKASAHARLTELKQKIHHVTRNQCNTAEDFRKARAALKTWGG